MFRFRPGLFSLPACLPAWCMPEGSGLERFNFRRLGSGSDCGAAPAILEGSVGFESELNIKALFRRRISNVSNPHFERYRKRSMTDRQTDLLIHGLRLSSSSLGRSRSPMIGQEGKYPEPSSHAPGTKTHCCMPYTGRNHAARGTGRERWTVQREKEREGE